MGQFCRSEFGLVLTAVTPSLNVFELYLATRSLIFLFVFNIEQIFVSRENVYQ